MSNRDALIELLRCGPGDFNIQPPNSSACYPTTSTTCQPVSLSSSCTSSSDSKDAAYHGIAMTDMDKEPLDQALRDSGYEAAKPWESDACVASMPVICPQAQCARLFTTFQELSHHLREKH